MLIFQQQKIQYVLAYLTNPPPPPPLYHAPLGLTLSTKLKLYSRRRAGVWGEIIIPLKHGFFIRWLVSLACALVNDHRKKHIESRIGNHLKNPFSSWYSYYLDGNSEDVVQALCEIGFFKEKRPICYCSGSNQVP